jgi:hypothetical protein
MSKQSDEEQFEETLTYMFEHYSDYRSGFEELECNQTNTFKDKGIMTMNNGIVVKLYNGKEFQLYIVKSN